MTKAEARALAASLSPKDKVLLAKKPIEAVYGIEKQAIGAKPQGLWYACGAEWVEWVLAEMPEWLRGYKYAYALRLDTSRMLQLKTLAQLEAFTRRYLTVVDNYPTDYDIDWPAAAKKYGGIEICPYQGEARMELGWYYGWDVASGCVWDGDVVLGLTQIFG